MEQGVLWKAMILFLLSFLLVGCSRQFSVTINENPVYDPRTLINSFQVKDADLQGCLNLALSQQEITNPADLVVLSCANGNVRALDGIEQYTSLRFLDLANNRISNLLPLSTMDRLSGLSIPDNALTDISILFSMTGLTAAILSGNEGIPCDQLDRLQQKLGENLTRSTECAR